MNVLLVNWESGGTMPPFLGLARRLLERNHEVRLLSDEANRADAGLVPGLGFVPWSRAPSRRDKSAASDTLQDWRHRFAPMRFNRLIEAVMVGPARGYAADVAEEVGRQRPNVLVVNEAILGGLIAGEATGVPTVAVSPHPYQYPAPNRPMFGLGLSPMSGPIGRLRDSTLDRFVTFLYDRHLSSLNIARRAFSLPPVRHVIDVVDRADRLLVMTSAAFDFVPDPLPPHVRYVGAILDDPVATGDWASPWLPGDDDPLVLVALSMTYMGQEAALQRIAAALGDLPVRGLITTGPAIDPISIRTPRNVRVVTFAPHGAVLPLASAMITHGGHGGVMRALAHDVPLVVMPFGRDQLDNAARITSRGAGLRISARSQAPEIRRALTRTLSDPSLRAGAASLGAHIRRDSARSMAVDEIESVARGRGPS